MKRFVNKEGWFDRDDWYRRKKGIQKEVTIDRKKNLRAYRLYWIGHRAQDIFFSALALIVLSPVMLITALAVVIDDPGGVQFLHRGRVGRDGKLFKFYKFWSMCVGVEVKLEALLDQNEMDGPVFKIKDDPRITRVGKSIGKTSIDKLLQL